MVHSAQRLSTDVVDDVSFVQRNTVKQAQITQFFSATEADTCNLPLTCTQRSASHIFDNAKLMPGSTGHNGSCRGKTNVVLNSKAIWGGFGL
jgi:hypothetical protein